MSKVFHSLGEGIAKIEDFAFNQILPIVTGFVVEDLAEPVNGYVPYQEGDLTDSIFKASSIQKGIVGHSTPYAEAVWYHNLTGQEEWTKKFWEDNSEELLQAAVDEFKF